MNDWDSRNKYKSYPQNIKDSFKTPDKDKLFMTTRGYYSLLNHIYNFK